MSDDDYYMDDDFGGFDDDLYWDDDVSQNLADDLAEHTMPSPVYPEDPHYEMMAGYSDWEYYSDDYYDDDPGLQKERNTQVGSPPAILKIHQNDIGERREAKRGKKRKLVETEDIPDISLDPNVVQMMQNVAHNIKGTVWRSGGEESEEPHTQGRAKRVALLKDWRHIFQDTQPKSDRRSKQSSRKASKLVEDWANDLGLADMGLMAAKGKSMDDGIIANRYQAAGDKVEVDYAEEEDDMDEEDVFVEETVRPSRRNIGTDPAIFAGDVESETTRKDRQSLEDSAYHEPLSIDPNVTADQVEQILPSRKRKKAEPDARKAPENRHESGVEAQHAKQVFMKPQRTKEADLGSEGLSVAHISTEDTSGEQKRGGRPRKAADKPVLEQQGPSSRKRKASDEAETNHNEEGAKGSAAASRAKRVASTKLVTGKESKPAVKGSASSTKSAPVSRTRRSSRK